MIEVTLVDAELKVVPLDGLLVVRASDSDAGIVVNFGQDEDASAALSGRFSVSVRRSLAQGPS